MKSELQNSNSTIQQNSFQTIYQRRVNQLEQKVNKYCAQYDALMNLLPIGNHISSVLGFQKDIGQISSKIEVSDEKITQLNDRDIQIDNTHWQKQLNELKRLLKDNQVQLEKILVVQQEEQRFDDSLLFQHKLFDKLKIHERIILSKLAHHKNTIQLERHKQLTTNYLQIQKSIDKKVNQHFGPIHKELEQIQQQLQICRLKIPLRQVKKFSDFNYHRLVNEILEVNEMLQEMFSKCHGVEINIDSDINRKINQIENQIESIFYQIQGSKRRCLNSLVASQFVDCGYRLNINQLQKSIRNQFTQLEDNINQVKSKYDLIQQHILTL